MKIMFQRVSKELVPQMHFIHLLSSEHDVSLSGKHSTTVIPKWTGGEIWCTWQNTGWGDDVPDALSDGLVNLI